jgi:toxin ParE1/3/4
LIRWSKLASTQFKAIHDYIAADSLSAARKQGSLILQAINRLDAFPLLGRIGTSPDKRELVIPDTPYVVYYRLNDGVIFLRSIRHAAREKPARFKK